MAANKIDNNNNIGKDLRNFHAHTNQKKITGNCLIMKGFSIFKTFPGKEK